MKLAIYIFLSSLLLACSEGSFTSKTGKAPGEGGSSGGDGGLDGDNGTATVGGTNSGDAINPGGGGNVIGFGSDGDGSNATIVIDGKITNESGFKPVLALASPACIACHAKINGDLITNFNVDKNPFSSRSGGNALVAEDSMRHDGIGSMNLDGNLIIPKVTISGGIFADRLGRTDMTLKEALTTSFSYAGIPAAPNMAGGKAIKVLGETRNKAAAGVNKLTEVSTVSINPPTTAEIMNLENTAGIKALIPSSGSISAYGLTGTSKIEGFSFVNGASGEAILKNVGPSAVCEGDILVTGSVVLSRLTDLKVGDGCRFYVAKSLFITGEVTLTGSEKRNLQIAAGREVMMGIKLGRFSTSVKRWPIGYDDLVNARPFLEDAHFSTVMMVNGKPVANSYYEGTFARTSGNYWLNKSTGYRDPSQCYGECYFVHLGTIAWQAQYRKRHNYERILITANSVDSRYYGKFKGIIISNMALFALTHFNFEADSVFEGVPILPRLGKQILSVK